MFCLVTLRQLKLAHLAQVQLQAVILQLKRHLLNQAHQIVLVNLVPVPQANQAQVLLLAHHLALLNKLI